MTVDNSGFGTDWLDGYSALADARAIFRSAGHTPPTAYWFPEGRHSAPDGLVPHRTEFLQANRAVFSSGVIEVDRALLINPTGAVVADHDGAPLLIAETNWHAHLDHHPRMRRDATTGWRYRWVPISPAHEIDETCLICQNTQLNIYFHWFFDVLSKIWLFQRFERSGLPKVFFGDIRHGFQIETLNLLGVEREDVLPSPCATEALLFTRAILPLFEFREQHRTRFSRDRGVHHKGWPPEYVADLRERVLHACGIGRPARDLRLYVARSDAARRRVLNEDAVRARCEAHGFQTVTPGALSFRDQVALFARASAVVGCHGAGLTNILWCGIGGTLVEFMPNGYDDASYRFLAPLVGMDYHCLFCDTDDPERMDNMFSDCTVDVELLDRILAEL